MSDRGSPMTQDGGASEGRADGKRPRASLIGAFRWMLVFTGALLVILAVLLARLPERREVGDDEVHVVAPTDFGPAPEFALTERSGATVGSKDLKGKVWIADFIFTRCSGPCPMMSARMARLQDELAGVEDVRLVSFTVDPRHDTPEVLRTYARQFNADEKGWLFLTGTLDEMEAVQLHGFKLGDKTNPLHHSDRFILVDREGRIRGYFDMNEEGAVARLARQTRDLAEADRE